MTTHTENTVPLSGSIADRPEATFIEVGDLLWVRDVGYPMPWTVATVRMLSNADEGFFVHGDKGDLPVTYYYPSEARHMTPAEKDWVNSPSSGDGAEHVTIGGDATLTFDEGLGENLYEDPFLTIATELVDLHDRKGADYGTDSDPYANVRMSEGFGIPAWMGVAIRMNDKIKRLQTAGTQLVREGEVSLANEGLEDAFLDLAVYGIIGIIMVREWTEAQA